MSVADSGGTTVTASWKWSAVTSAVFDLVLARTVPVGGR
jgi:hypothetical protein